MPIFLVTAKGNLWVKGDKREPELMDAGTRTVTEMDGHETDLRGEDINRMTVVSQADYEGAEKAKHERELKATMTQWITEITQAGVISEGVKMRILATINPENPNPGNGPKLIVPGGR